MTKTQVIALYGKRVKYTDPKTKETMFGMAIGYDPKPSPNHQEGNWVVISPDHDKIGPWIHVLDAEVSEE